MAVTFAVAPDAAFRIMGAAAVYTPPAGAPADVTVVLTGGSSESGNLLRGRVARAWLADIRASDVSQPEKNATLVVADCEALPGGGSFVVDDFRADLIGLVWHLDLKKIG